MAAVPIAGLTALQAVVTHGELETRRVGLGQRFSWRCRTFRGDRKGVWREGDGCLLRTECRFCPLVRADAVIAYDKEDIHFTYG